MIVAAARSIGKVPSVAGHVPVKFVVIFEPADHPRRAVADRVIMLSRRNHAVGATDADSNAIS